MLTCSPPMFHCLADNTCNVNTLAINKRRIRVFKLRCDELVLGILSPLLTVELATYILTTDEGARKHGQNAKLLQFGRLHVTKQSESSRKNDPSQYVKLYKAICTRFC